ncbi:MAG: hydrogenase 4 subunit B [Acidimicrobiaceae bacterium]|nr:hydrogenase 4 subunit B [Acidimicrobiaceae bacterium]
MTLFLVALGLCAAAAVAGATFPRGSRVVVSSVLGSLGCLIAFSVALRILLTGDTVTFHTAQVLPMTGVSLTLDPLGAWFVLASSFVGVATCLYNVGYARGAMASRSALSLFMVFVLSLLVVPSASSIMTLMFAWELMALSSLLLILTDQARHPDARSAALWYGVMTQLGAASILLGLLVMTSNGSGQNFADLSAHSSTLSPVTRSFAFVLVLLGFASKAGAVPLHVWLPKAHPEAPSPVSALMSSSMVAMGIYGIIRVGEGLLHGGTVWWWIAVALLGVVSAFYGALHATTSTDLKRLLAYSTIDIIGLVLIGVGAAGALADSGQPVISRLAMSAALLLVVAHAAFKGALFLAAGAVERATATRNLDLLGGLIHTMPVTALVVALSAGAIMAVPTLSGFSSEWLLLQGLLHGFSVVSTPTVIVMLLGVIALALTGGLTAVAFVKAFGIGFLGQSRSSGAAQAHEVSKFMTLAMGWLVIPSVVIGVMPGLFVPLLDRAASSALGTSTVSPFTRGAGLEVAQLSGAIQPAAILIGLVAVMVIVWALNQALAQRRARRVDAWGCGRDWQTPRMQYTATSFAEPLQRVFADVLRPQSDVEVTHVAESRYYEQSLVYENRVADILEARGYRPIIAVALRVGQFARRLQNGSIHRYLAFGFVALLVILVVVG